MVHCEADFLSVESGAGRKRYNIHTTQFLCGWDALVTWQASADE